MEQRDVRVPSELRRQSMVVRGEQTAASNGLGEVSQHRRRQSSPVKRGGAPPQLIDDDQRVSGAVTQDGSRFLCFHEERALQHPAQRHPHQHTRAPGLATTTI